MSGPWEAVGRAGRTAQNLLEVARFGGLRTDDQPAPYDVVAGNATYRLRRYLVPDSAGSAPRSQVLLVPPLMLTSEVFDVSENASAVRTLVAHGAQPWVVDFGAPEREVGGLRRTMEQHVLAIDDAVDHVVAATGRPVHLVGYSQGGMFAYQTAAFRRNVDVRSVVTFGSPVDLHVAAPFGLPAALTVRGAPVAGGILGGRAVPGWATRTTFRLLDPVGAAKSRASFLLSLHDRESLLPREGQRRFLMDDGWVAWPGPALQYFLDNFVVHNRMMAGGFSVAGKAVSLADLAVPVLSFVGEADEIAPCASVRAIRGAAPSADVHELTLPTGHFGLVVGRSAMRTSWPVVAQWADHWDSGAPLPEGVRQGVPEAPRPAARRHLEVGVSAAASVARRATRRATTAAARPVDGVRSRSVGSLAQFRRLARLDLMTAQTRISLGAVLAEQGARRPGEAAFLFEDNVHDFATVDARVDGLVRALVARGVVPGEHVGVLMRSRPTALALIAALNRLGAVAVVLRPDGDAAREADLGEVSRVFTDPEHAGVDLDGRPSEVLLLSRGAGSPADEGDLGREEPARLPQWYRPNPGRASDLAFVLFSGPRDRPRRMAVTNGRWALTAYGTAASARLSSRDTVLTMSPVHHPAGLLTAFGGAVAAGARLAMVSGLDPATFWEEVRRYGVTVVSYTWTELLDLVEAPAHPGERQHGIRLFLGSGMPKGLWLRVLRRFTPAQVLEFWSSTEGAAILANLPGGKPGSAGRPLPGAAELRLVRFDGTTGRLVRDADGWAVPAADDEPGMLLAHERHGIPAGTGALRGVFAPEDTWRVTGTVFRRDADGDYWLLGSLHDVVPTADGPVITAGMVMAFGELGPVTGAVAYGLPTAAGDELTAVALSVRDGEGVTEADLALAAAGSAPQPPVLVHVVNRVPTTSAHRPDPAPLRASGVDLEAGPAWRWDSLEGRYVELTRRDLDDLLG